MNHIRFVFVNDTTLASDNPLRFGKNLFKYNKNDDNNDKITDEKLRYHINREVAKISALLSDKFINMNILLVKIYYHLINNQ